METHFEPCLSLYEGKDEFGRHVWNVYTLPELGKRELPKKRTYDEHWAWAEKTNPKLKKLIKEIEKLTNCSVFRVQLERNKGEAPR